MHIAGTKQARRERAREDRWVLLDFVDLVVHAQHADEPTFYDLKRLWKASPRIPIDEDVPVDEADEA